MNTLDLIQNLSSDLKPVKPLKSLGRRVFELLLLGFHITTSGVIYWYFKKNEFHIPAWRGLLEVLLLISAIGLFAVLASKSVSPHHSKASVSRWSPVPLILWFVVLFVAFLQLYTTLPGEALVALDYNTWLCPIVIGSIALPVSIATFLYLNRGVIHFPALTFMYWAGLSLASGALGLSFICPWEDPLHELLWHVLPVFAVIPIAVLVATLLFRAISEFQKKIFLK